MDVEGRFVPWAELEWRTGGKKVVGLVKENISESAVRDVVDVEADKKVSPCVVASLRVHFCEVESGVCVGGDGSYNLEDVLAYVFEIGDTCTWVACHEVAVGLIAVWD